MSAIIYNLTVTDRKGKVIVETIHTSPVVLIQELPKIRQLAEDYIKEQEEELTQKLQEKNAQN